MAPSRPMRTGWSAHTAGRRSGRAAGGIGDPATGELPAGPPRFPRVGSGARSTGRGGDSRGRVYLPGRSAPQLGRPVRPGRVRAGDPPLAPRRDRRLGRRAQGAGGVHVVTETRDPNTNLGPVLARTDAPLLFSAVNEVARRLAVELTAQIRLVPCPAAAWWRGAGLPGPGPGPPLAAPVLTLAELRPRDHRPRTGAPGAGRRDRGRAVGPVRGRDYAGRSTGRGGRGMARSAPGPGCAAGVLMADRTDRLGPGGPRRPSAAAIAGGSAAAAPSSRSPWSSPCSARCWSTTNRPLPTLPTCTRSSGRSGFACRPTSTRRCGSGSSPARASTDDPAHLPCPTTWPSSAYPDPVLSSAARPPIPPRHVVPGRPRSVRADAPQPPLRSPYREPSSFPQGRYLSAGSGPPASHSRQDLVEAGNPEHLGKVGDGGSGSACVRVVQRASSSG